MFAGIEISEVIAQSLSCPTDDFTCHHGPGLVTLSPPRCADPPFRWLVHPCNDCVIFFPNSVFYYFYFPLSFIALLLIGWKAGILMELMILAALIAFSQYHLVPFRSAQSISTLLISFFLASLGWASFDTFNSATHWACFYYREAVDHLVEARKNRWIYLK